MTKVSRVSTLVGAVALCALLPVICAPPAIAGGGVGSGEPATCTEAALDSALAGGGAVTFNCGDQPVTVTVTAAKTIVADTTIDGSALITLSGGGRVQIFTVNSGVSLSLSNMTLARGSTDSGGAIFNSGELTVNGCTFSDNRAPNGGDGGAIDNYGTATITNSTFAHNSTSGVGGAIENNGTMIVANSTFFRNRALVGGTIAAAGTLTITNCTFSGNRSVRSGVGGAIYAAGDVLLQNSIVTDSGRGGNCAGPVIDGGHNLRWPPSDTSCVGTFGAPKLAPPANNRGPTRTLRLRPGSAAIDAGDDAICAAAPVNNRDERGVVRPGVGSTSCSIGAYEY